MQLNALSICAALAAGAILLPQAANATVLPSPKVVQALKADSSMVEHVRRDGRRCWRWRHKCAKRWGWGGFGFRRCVIRHGCW